MQLVVAHIRGTSTGRQRIVLREAIRQTTRITSVGNERGHRGGGRGRGAPRGVAPIFHNVSLRLNHSPSHSPQPQRAPVVRQPVHPPEVHEDVEIEEVQDQGDELGAVEDDMALGAETNSGAFAEIHEPELDSPEEREKFYQEVRAFTV